MNKHARLGVVGVAAVFAVSLSVPSGMMRVLAQIKEIPSIGFELEVGDGPDSKNALRRRLKVYTPDPVKYPIPRTTFDGKPDLNGAYWAGVNVADPEVPLESLYRPDVRAYREQEDVVKWKDGFSNNIFHCIPGTPVGASTRPNAAVQLIYTPGLLVMLDEEDGNFRVIPIVADAASARHSLPSRKSYMGDSVGYWEGDNLIVDVTNFNGMPWLADSPVGKLPPWKTSDALHIVEKWTLSDGQTLDYQSTIEDPKMLTAKWVAPVVRRRPAGYDTIAEAFCEQQPDLVQREVEAREWRIKNGLPASARDGAQ